MEKGGVSTGETSERNINTYLGDDLVMEILVRLPIKPLFRSKCVSRLWNRLVSGNQFQRRLLLPYGVFCRSQLCEPENYRYVRLSDESSGDCGIGNISLGFLPHYPDVSIIDSCNGLLLVLWLHRRTATKMKYYVCNPLTQKCVVLPSPHIKEGYDTAKLIFDPAVSPHFQVVLAWNPAQWVVTDIMVDIFSSDTGQWVYSDLQCEPTETFFLPTKMTILNGILYSLIWPKHSLALNIKEGVCGLIKLPTHNTYIANLVFQHCRGCLYYITCDDDPINIWALTDSSTSEWTLKHTVTVKQLLKKVPLPRCCRSDHKLFHPIGLHSEMEVVFLKAHCKIYSYDFISMKLKVLCSSDRSRGLSFSKYPYPPIYLYKPWPNALGRVSSPMECAK